MKCEYCLSEHNGEYGSGRFCCKKCACGFSTREKRAEINEQVRQKALLAGGSPTDRLRTPEAIEKRKRTVLEKYGSLSTFTEKDRQKGIEALKKLKQEKYEQTPFIELSYIQKKRRLIEERGYTCEWCLLDSWRDKPIPLEVDHIDGNKQHNTRENLRLLCPNCHAQTDTYKGKNNKK